MSCCDGLSAKRFPDTGYCENGCSMFESRTRSCRCQSDVRCCERADCVGFRPTGSAATGACPGPCQCVEEEIWNSNVPPKPNCDWLNNFAELRRQWSDHGRQLSCKCCNCRSCRPAAPCRPCLPVTPSCSVSVLPCPDYQDRCNDHNLNGTCNNPEIHPMESPCSDNVSTQDCACAVPHTPCPPFEPCQPCAPQPKAILKNRSCCQCSTESCLCQPMARNCNCPPPIQVDVRAVQDCTCECPSSAECACPVSERRLARSKVRCPNARLCCPFPRPPPGPKCCSLQCQPCPSARRDPCAALKCRPTTPNMKSCRSESPGTECRQAAACGPCCKTTPSCYGECGTCEEKGRRARSADRSSICWTRTGAADTPAEAFDSHLSKCTEQRKNGSPCCNVLVNILRIGRSTLVPGPLAVVYFVLLIFIAVTCSSGLTMYRRYLRNKKNICWRY